jgi:hypothetical protein
MLVKKPRSPHDTEKACLSFNAGTNVVHPIPGFKGLHHHLLQVTPISLVSSSESYTSSLKYKTQEIECFVIVIDGNEVYSAFYIARYFW